jgi:hypothetical protein
MCDVPTQRVLSSGLLSFGTHCFVYTLPSQLQEAGKLYKCIDRWLPHRINATCHIFVLFSYKLRFLSSRNAPHAVTPASVQVSCLFVYLSLCCLHKIILTAHSYGNITACGLYEVYRRFWGTYWLHLQGPRVSRAGKEAEFSVRR